jgi:hypothetical protein
MAIYKWVGDTLTATVSNIGANNSGIKNRAFKSGTKIASNLTTSYQVQGTATNASYAFVIDTAVPNGTAIYASVFFNSGSTYSYSTASETVASYTPSTAFTNNGTVLTCYNDYGKTNTISVTPYINGSRSASKNGQVTVSVNGNTSTGYTNTAHTLQVGDLQKTVNSSGSGSLNVTATLSSNSCSSKPSSSDGIVAKSSFNGTINTISIKGAVASIAPSKSNVTLCYGESVNVTYTLGSYYDGSANYIYSKTVVCSGNTTYVNASIPSAGTVSIAATGSNPTSDEKATITLKSNCTSKSAAGITTSISVTVKKVSVSNITLNPGDKNTVSLPSGFTSGNTLTITSGNTSIATVSGSTITAVAAGSAIMTIKIGSKEVSTFTVTVKNLSVTVS